VVLEELTVELLIDLTCFIKAQATCGLCEINLFFTSYITTDIIFPGSIQMRNGQG
jgi:hypothetical protein